MVIYDEKKISNGDYVHAYSDSGRYIIRVSDGSVFGHYWFPKEHDLQFEEGDPIEQPDPDDIDEEEALSILLGGESK